MNNRSPFIRRASYLLCSLAVISLCGAGRDSGLSREELQQRRKQIAAMGPAEKDQLRRKWEWFQNASPEVRDQLRQLEAEVRRDPQRDQLEAIMQRHHEWFESLPPATQRSLRQLDPGQRLEMVEQIRRRQSATRMLANDELRDIMRVMFEFAVQRFGRDPDKAGWIRGSKGEGRPRMNEWMAGRLMDQMDEEQFAKVVEKLHPDSRKALQAAGSFEDQRAQLAGWIHHTVSQRYRQYGQVPDEELRTYFLELSPSQRDRLEALPPEQMKKELTRMFRDRQGKLRPPFPGPGGPGPGGPGRPGEGRRGPGRDGRGHGPDDRSQGGNPSSPRKDDRGNPPGEQDSDAR